jgi:MoaA/NifB/PqqE/SkfB family radical SAM enzyme
LLKNTAFCVLPFIEQFQNINGKKYFCCYSYTAIDHVNSASSQELRKKIWNGEKIDHCKNCYAQEEQNILSPRLLESTRWLKDPEVKNYIDNWNDTTDLQTFFYDLRFDNKCNLACISCNPENSSLWARELNIVTAEQQLDTNLDEWINAKKIYLAGGEPLVIDKFIQLIQKVSELSVQPELVINTNLTNVTDQLKQILSKIKNLTLVISVDAHGKVNEYHRWPLKWSKFLQNLQSMKDLDCTIQFNTVVDAVTVLNIHDLVMLEEFADQWNLTVLNSPEALLVNNLPDIYKFDVKENFCKIKQSKFYKKNPIFKTRVDNVIQLIMQKGDDFLLSGYIKQIDQRRNIDHRDYLGMDLT